MKNKDRSAKFGVVAMVVFVIFIIVVFILGVKRTPDLGHWLMISSVIVSFFYCLLTDKPKT